MVTSTATTPDEYVASLPEDRAAAVQAVRDVVNANLPAGYRLDTFVQRDEEAAAAREPRAGIPETRIRSRIRRFPDAWHATSWVG